MKSSKRDAGRESAQSYAMRVWSGQSPDVKREERIRRVESALLGQGYSPAGIEYPPTTEPAPAADPKPRRPADKRAARDSLLVAMSHPYLSLEYVAEAMGRAAIGARKMTGAPATDATYALADAVHDWHDTLYRLCKDCAIPGRHRDTLKREEWRHLDLDQDLLWVEDLNACEALTAQGLRFEVVPDQVALREDGWIFKEVALNGHPINWGYWVKGMNKWTLREAARLMVGLDPEVFRTLDERPCDKPASKATVDPSDWTNLVRRIERLAMERGLEQDTPEGWLWWAREACYWPIHSGFLDEVEASFAAKTQASLDALPEAEATLWKSAPEAPEGGRIIVRPNPQGSSTGRWTCAQFVREVEQRLERWRRGEYMLAEAAELTAQKIGKSLLAQLKMLEEAVGDGEDSLRLRDHGIKLSGDLMPRGPHAWRLFLQKDINAWLERQEADYRLEYPYPEYPDTVEAPAAAAVDAARAEPIELAPLPWDEPGFKSPVQPESMIERRKRRLSAFYAMGGVITADSSSGNPRIGGGVVDQFIAKEKASGRAATDHKTVRGDLIAAFEEDEEARRAGDMPAHDMPAGSPFSGLGAYRKRR